MTKAEKVRALAQFVDNDREVAATLRAYADLLEERERLIAALIKITRLPHLPAPDPNAHSWQAWGQFWMRTATDMKFVAINATAAKLAEEKMR